MSHLSLQCKDSSGCGKDGERYIAVPTEEIYGGLRAPWADGAVWSDVTKPVALIDLYPVYESNQILQQEVSQKPEEWIARGAKSKPGLLRLGQKM